MCFCRSPTHELRFIEPITLNKRVSPLASEKLWWHAAMGVDAVTLGTGDESGDAYRRRGIGDTGTCAMTEFGVFNKAETGFRLKTTRFGQRAPITGIGRLVLFFGVFRS